MPSNKPNIFIARGTPENIAKSIVLGIELYLVESILGYIPTYLVDSSNRVHLWGIPETRSLKAWLKAKKNDLLLIYERGPKKTSENIIITQIKWKYPLDPDNQIEKKKAEELSKNIWKAIKISKKKKLITHFPYLLFTAPVIVTRPLKEVTKILGITEKNFRIGFRQSLQSVAKNKIKPNAVDSLLNLLAKVPETPVFLRILEEEYVALCRKYSGEDYGYPILIGNKEIWGREGLYEKVNERLVKLGYRELSWTEFKKYLSALDDPAYYGKVWINKIIAKTGDSEPHSITFSQPVFLKQALEI